MSNQKIILVEDDPILSKVLFEELKDAGFQVWQAFDGEAGLGLIQSKLPDLVLLDVMMPKKTGFEVLEELKKSPKTQRIPVIILSLLGADEDVKKGLQMGANDYIVKSQHAVAEVVEKVKSFFEKESHPEGKMPVKPLVLKKATPASEQEKVKEPVKEPVKESDIEEKKRAEERKFAEVALAEEKKR